MASATVPAANLLGSTISIDGGVPLVATSTEVREAPRLPGTDPVVRLLNAPDQERFTAESALGLGATSEVWEVRDRSLDRSVAVKVMRAEYQNDIEGRSGFIAEARLTASLNHPNVLPVLGFDLTADGRPYIAMTRIDGTSLGSAIESSRQGARADAIADFNAIVSIAIAVCNATAYAHHRGIIHQDIKPDNILLGGFGEVLLLDWGSAARLSGPSDRVTSKLYGTPLYMSPEQARGEYADRRSDIYCIGASLFHALLLRLPTWSNEPTSFWECKKSGTYQPPGPDERRAAPPALVAIAMKAISANPQARYQSAEDMRHDLELYQAGMAVAAFREPWWLRLRRWHGRHAAVVWSGLVTCAALSLAIWVLVAEWRVESSPWTPMPEYAASVNDQAAFGTHWRLRKSFTWSGPFHDVPVGIEPAVRLEGGVITIAPGESLCDLSLGDAIRGDVRFAWDYCARAAGDNLNCFIGAGDRLSGFTFHVAGFGMTDTCRLTYAGDEYLVTAPLGFTIVKDQPYRFQLERDGRHLRLSIDGRTIIDYLDAEDLGGSLGECLGIDVTPNHIASISHIEVWRRAVARRVSPLEVGDALFEVGAWDDAAARYREIENSQPGTSFAMLAEMRQAMCAYKLKEYPQSEARLLAFSHAHAGSELAPMALARALRIAFAEQDGAVVERCIAALRSYQGNPLMPGILHEYGGWLASPIAKLPRAQMRAAVTAGQRRMHEVATTLGLTDSSDDDFCTIAGSALVSHGFLREATMMDPCIPSVVAAALLKMGQPAEVIRRFHADPELCADSRLSLGLLREVADDAHVDLTHRELACFHLGDFDGMRALDPHDQMVGDLDIYGGRIDAYLASHPVDEFGLKWAGFTPHAAALLLAGRYEEVASTYTFGQERGWALAGLGHYQEAFAACDTVNATETVAAIYGQSGQRALLPAMLRQAADQVQDIRRVRGFLEIEYWLPLAVLQAGAGDIAGARSTCAAMSDAATKETSIQRPWYMGAYALGRIDDQAFLAQPCQLQVSAMLQLAQALRLDCAGETREAAQRYQAVMTLPFWQRDLGEPLNQALVWRLRLASLSVPVQCRIGYLGYNGR